MLVPGDHLPLGRLGGGQAGAGAEGPPVAGGVLEVVEEPVGEGLVLERLAVLLAVGISASACSIFPASPRSPAPSRPSDVTETESSTTCRYATQVSNDFGDPVDFRWVRFY
jgi:hypothetical protein